MIPLVLAPFGSALTPVSYWWLFIAAEIANALEAGSLLATEVILFLSSLATEGRISMPLIFKSSVPREE